MSNWNFITFNSSFPWMELSLIKSFTANDGTTTINMGKLTQAISEDGSLFTDAALLMNERLIFT